MQVGFIGLGTMGARMAANCSRPDTLPAYRQKRATGSIARIWSRRTNPRIRPTGVISTANGQSPPFLEIGQAIRIDERSL